MAISDTKFHNKYRIQSTRAEWHDYNGGLYHVTLCTKNREHYFGEIADGIMYLSEIGEYADEQFRNVNNHYPYAENPLFVIMPNHIHCITLINGVDNVVETMCTSSLPSSCTSSLPSSCTSSLPNRWKSETIDKNMQNISLHRGKLSTVIGGLKRAVTHYANENKIRFGWQPRFYDSIIKNNADLQNIVRYIENNVINWKSDKSCC